MPCTLYVVCRTVIVPSAVETWTMIVWPVFMCCWSTLTGELALLADASCCIRAGLGRNITLNYICPVVRTVLPIGKSDFIEQIFQYSQRNGIWVTEISKISSDFLVMITNYDEKCSRIRISSKEEYFHESGSTDSETFGMTLLLCSNCSSEEKWPRWSVSAVYHPSRLSAFNFIANPDAWPDPS